MITDLRQAIEDCARLQRAAESRGDTMAARHHKQGRAMLVRAKDSVIVSLSRLAVRG